MLIVNIHRGGGREVPGSDVLFETLENFLIPKYSPVPNCTSRILQKIDFLHQIPFIITPNFLSKLLHFAHFLY